MLELRLPKNIKDGVVQEGATFELEGYLKQANGFQVAFCRIPKRGYSALGVRWEPRTMSSRNRRQSRLPL